MVYLSRIIVELLTPLNLSFLLFLLSLIFLLMRWVRIGTIALAAGLAVLTVSGYGLGVRELIEKKEYAYLPLSDGKIEALLHKDIRHVVVLGNGHTSDPRLPGTSQIGGSSLYRLIEGVRIQRRLPESRLVIMGGAVFDSVPNADVVSTVASQIGVAAESMIIVNSPKNTMQEADLALPLVRDQEFILVTSAMHMSRAMEIFKNLGMRPIPSPTDYLMKGKDRRDPGRFLPSAENLELSKRIIYEWIGSTWMRTKESIISYL